MEEQATEISWAVLMAYRLKLTEDNIRDEHLRLFLSADIGPLFAELLDLEADTK